MGVKTLVRNPERLRRPEEVDDVLYRISIYERERTCEAGVLLIQRMGFSGLYEIVSKRGADEWMSRPVYDDGKGNRTCEWGIKFYPRSYFEELREKMRTQAADDSL